MTVVHTSGTSEGQIYMPDVNNMLMVACIALVVGFKTSTALAAAYGIAVTGTMAITTVLFYAVVTKNKSMSRAGATFFLVFFLAIDLPFFAANAVKILDGGWFPIAVAAFVFMLMTTWKRGRLALGAFMAEATLPLDVFLADLEANPIHRIPGTGVFMTSNPNGVPPVLLHHVKHNRVLHEHIVLLSVASATMPEVPAEQRTELTVLPQGFCQLKVRYGFMESPDIPEVLHRNAGGKFPNREHDVTYYLGRETLLTTGSSTLATWRKKVFSLMSRNAQPATAFFNIPPNRVVELGTQVQL